MSKFSQEDSFTIRHGQPETRLSEQEFKQRYREQFYDPSFDSVRKELNAVAEIAWTNYRDSHKAPFQSKAGLGYADPEYKLSKQWVETRDRLRIAEEKQKDPQSQRRVLLISGSSRNEHTCPGEISKSYRLIQSVQKIYEDEGFQVDILDLSVLTAEYGKIIHPCKSCVSTAMPLCHWPCSCYPNHGLGQAPDWMNEIYERWVAAHGVMIITPVNWYQVPSGLKLMMDRLVCADGGNPDPTSTHGKNAAEAKRIELDGWSYPKHLAGRAFSVIAHGDSVGAEDVRRILTNWLLDMHLVQAGYSSSHSQYIGYLKPYATSHEDLDKEEGFFKNVENAALSLIQQIKFIRDGHETEADKNLSEANPK